MKNKIIISALLLILISCQKNSELRFEELNSKYGIYIDKLDYTAINQNLNAGQIPIALKDNIDAKGFANTAGSIALKDNYPSNNAFLVQKLIDNGYFIQGKTNLSEWANFRSISSTSGWSSMGGQTVNPYGLNRNPCGSSSGSAVAVALGVVDIAIGTETNGSISCPSSVNGIVGIKPSVGLVSRSGIIPISNTQDTAGPMAQTVFEAAKVLEVISGVDPKDPATSDIPSDMDFSFSKDLNKDAIQGKRFGILSAGNKDPEGQRLISKFTKILVKLGGIVVEIDDNRTYPSKEEFFVLKYEFREGIESYLSQSNSNFKTLKDLIDFNNENADSVLKFFDQSIFLMSDSTQNMEKTYEQSLKVVLDSRQQIDKLLSMNDLDALVGLSRGPAWNINHSEGDRKAIQEQRSWSVGSFAAMAGYPNVIIPLDVIDGLPVGLSFIGTKWSDKSLIQYAFSFEQSNGFDYKPREYFNK